ncbi:MAG: hypothetical protein KGM44_09590 [bacterium]|nr:hypothetical protein [bacterium]
MGAFGTLEFSAKVIDFVVFVALLVWLWMKYARPQLEAASEAENARIMAIEEALAKAKADAEAAREARRAADAERDQILRNAEESGVRDVAQQISDAEAQAGRIRAYAEGEVERQRYAASVQLRIEMIEEALAKARADAASRGDEALQASLVQRFLDDLARERKAVN